MPVKRIAIFANSVKKTQHCIAGRELVDRGGVLTFGDWIRPVSRHGQGELSWSDCRFPSGRTPRIFDVVDIPLAEREGSDCQPENWFIDPNRLWSDVTIEGNLPDPRVDWPGSLWLEPQGAEIAFHRTGLRI